MVSDWNWEICQPWEVTDNGLQPTDHIQSCSTLGHDLECSWESRHNIHHYTPLMKLQKHLHLMHIAHREEGMGERHPSTDLMKVRTKHHQTKTEQNGSSCANFEMK